MLINPFRSIFTPINVSSTGKISFSTQHVTNPTQLFTSEFPTRDILNASFASRNSPSSRFTATIPLHDSQSFVTDHQQTWPTQPQQPRLPTPSTPRFGPDQEADFVLFPTTATASVARRKTTPAPVTSRTAPKHSLGLAYTGRQHSNVNNSARQPSSVSPIQNPRVSNIIQGNGSGNLSPSSPLSNLTGQHQRFYASSAPSSSTALEHQSPRMRPPVPLFSSQSAGDMSRRASHDSHAEVVTNDQTMDELFSTPFSVDQEINFDDFSFTAVNGSSTAFDQQMPLSHENVSPTVSLADVQLNSDPASTSFTNLTTPGTDLWESPQLAHSTDTSPMFGNDNLPADSTFWPPLLNSDEFFGDSTVAQSIEQPIEQPFQDAHVAPYMSRNTSSPGKSSSRSSNQGRHSFTSGVGARRRDKPLPAITVDDPTDTVAMKRARNTMAARKSRQKRVQRQEELEAQIVDLEGQVDHWKGIARDLGYQE